MSLNATEFDLRAEMAYLAYLDSGKKTRVGVYAYDRIHDLSEAFATIDAHEKTIKHLRDELGRHGVPAAVHLNDYADEAASADPFDDAFSDLEDGFIALAAAVDDFHAWRTGTLPAERICEPDCGACQILAEVPDNIRQAAIEQRAAEPAGDPR